MGGITKERLQVGRIKMKDVNLKADLNAALTVLNAECPITVINCHICKQVPLESAHLRELKFLPEGIIEEIKEEFWINSKVEKIDHIFIWDVLVPVYLSNPQFFVENKIQVKAKTISDIKEGRLQQMGQKGVEINMPETVSDKKGFYQEIFTSWKSLHEHVLSEQGTYRNFKHSRIKQAIYKGLFSLLIPIALRVMYKKKGNYFYEE
jgi:inosine-uridine nucleoside N-ribohydrolase